MIYLLDVNVLLALRYTTHVHNARARTWLENLQTHDAALNLATCSIVELGFVRVACGKAAFAENVRVAQRDLERLKAQKPFVFLNDGLGACFLPFWVETWKHVTDGHLLKLAMMNHAQLATLDRGIPGALLIPEQPENPSMVREPPARYGVAA